MNQLNKNNNFLRTCDSDKNTGVAKHFDWERSKMEKFYDVILVTFFGDIVKRTPLK